jgi:hypothetical protein
MACTRPVLPTVYKSYEMGRSERLIRQTGCHYCCLLAMWITLSTSTNNKLKSFPVVIYHRGALDIELEAFWPEAGITLGRSGNKIYPRELQLILGLLL